MITPHHAGAAALFDLDGTFADTAPDMAFALNQLLDLEGREPLSFERIRPHVSHGGRGLIRLGFGLEPGDTDYDRLRQAFLNLYRDHLTNETRLFPGTEDLIATLEQIGVPWGIVTNKPAWLTDPLIAALGLTERAACVVSGDTTPNAKPHPGPLLHACRQIRVEPGQSWYVGDAERDVVAGRAAGTRTLVALFGYLGKQDRPTDWGADGLIQDPLEVLDWIGR